MSLSILSLIALLLFSSLKRFLVSLIAISLVSFFYFFSNLKDFLHLWLYFILQDLYFLLLHVVKKTDYVLKNKSLLYSWKSVLKFQLFYVALKFYELGIIIKLTCSIFMSSNNRFIIFFTYIEISKDPSAKYYQNNKERLQKSL